MARKQESKFKFRNADNIGAADAESDQAFLKSCFIDSGELQILSDCSDHRRIILGKTGSGKTALLSQLAEDQDRVINIKPESLALSYISNSTILKFIQELGVKLDIFFKLLWRHVFTVELLKRHFKIDNEGSKRSFTEKIKGMFRGEKDKKAIAYLEEWGKSFWEETEYRIKEVTTKLETDLEGAIRVKVPGIGASGAESEKLTEEQRAEIVQRAQHVVNEVQIRQLSDIIELADKVLDDPQKPYYITIDRLDEQWIEDRLRYRLIRALIETVRDFQRIRNAKLVVALRFDLLGRVFRLTRDAGFQEEKYESLYMPVEWNRESLIELLNTRIDHLIQGRYTRQAVTSKDILPRTCDGVSGVDFIVNRTLLRPRDVILFFNLCIKEAHGSPVINAEMIRRAEWEYSRLRLRAIGDEWSADYPRLMDSVLCLKAQQSPFRIGDIGRGVWDDLCLELATVGIGEDDPLCKSALEVIESGFSLLEFKRLLFHTLYKVGIVGLKLEAFEKTRWIGGRLDMSAAEIDEDCKVSVHPAFWRVLGIRTRVTA